MATKDTDPVVPSTQPRTSQGEAASGLPDASKDSRSVESWGDGGGGPCSCSAPDRASSQTRETSSEPLVNREQSPIGALIKPPYTTDPSRLAKAENGFVPKMDLALPLPPQFHWCRDCGAMVERCCHECSEDE